MTTVTGVERGGLGTVVYVHGTPVLEGRTTVTVTVVNSGFVHDTVNGVLG